MASERNHPAFSEPSHHSLSWAFQTYLVHDNEERSHWADVYNAFRYYAEFALCNWANQRHRVASLPECQQKFLPNGLRNTVEGQVRFQQYKEAAIANQFCLDSILGHAGMPHSQQNSPSTTTTTTTIASDDQFSKVSSVLKSLARDWSLEGKSERDMAYGPILKKVEEYLPISELPKYVPRICVPGAGKNISCHAMPYQKQTIVRYQGGNSRDSLIVMYHIRRCSLITVSMQELVG
jgi:N2227-like protein